MIFSQRYFSLLALVLISSCASPGGCVPNFKNLKTQYPHVIYHGPKVASEVVLKKYPPANWTPLAQISKKAQGAILLSEDAAFYHHPGYDEKQMREAIEQSIHAKKLKRGASTITQQVVKNIYLSKEKTVVRKVRELWMATKIEKVVGKPKILELYLNIAELGEGLFGIGAASQFYFHKSPSELSAKEGAFLAMLLPSPRKYSISFRKGALTPYARKIIRSILGKMVQARYISAEERDQEWAKPLRFEAQFDPSVPTEESMDSIDDEEGPAVDEPTDEPADPPAED